MKIWMAAREYSGIAEAGGVKNVVRSLSESLVKLGHEVLCFIPFYGCAEIECLSHFSRAESSAMILCAEKKIRVDFSSGILCGVKIILVGAECFSEKKDVYTYCAADSQKFPGKKIGEGYADNHLMNTVFQKAILAFGEELCGESDSPDVIHCHDACVAALPSIIKNFQSKNFSATKFVVSVHNAGPYYHHEFESVSEAKRYTGLPEKILERATNSSRVEPYLLASESAILSTVSPWYAEELLDANNDATDGLSQIFAERKTRIAGITNGFDSARYNPEDTSLSTLPFAFSPEKLDLEGKWKTREFFLKNIYSEFSKENQCKKNSLERSGFLDGEGKIYFSYHGRLVRQKGILVLLEAAREVLRKNKDARFIINGQGEESLREMCRSFAQEHRGRVVFFYGYEKSSSRLFTASADFAVLPSEFEPCGTEDFIAQTFATIPVAHATGGLKKIIDGKTGFLYEPNGAQNLAQTLLCLAQERLAQPEKFHAIIQEASHYVRTRYSWNSVAQEYLRLYAE